LLSKANPNWQLRCQVWPSSSDAVAKTILDVVEDKIAAIEVLYRDEIRQKLLTEFP
jgi:hypothetical protein